MQLINDTENEHKKWFQDNLIAYLDGTMPSTRVEDFEGLINSVLNKGYEDWVMEIPCGNYSEWPRLENLLITNMNL